VILIIEFPVSAIQTVNTNTLIFYDFSDHNLNVQKKKPIIIFLWALVFGLRTLMELLRQLICIA